MAHRKFLTLTEVRKLMSAAKNKQTGVRDSCLILLAFRHGFRISELLNLRFRDIELVEGRINIQRLKNGFSTVHPLMDDERNAIMEWKQVKEKWKPDADPDIVFISQRGTQLSRGQAWRIIKRAGELAGTTTHTHPHMLRHACGYELAERGTDTRLIQDYLGHRNIRHTVRYTASNAARFVGIWEWNKRRKK
ncbi:type 1 fimbriae regulatory protein FimE [Serratia fonticola]|uniref:Type 1 fimbriae regulatory protein FimE n=1 Tax=Serratia fonticola TaxID=47917 RepID=A0A542BK24_SERFO|nr:tyrosine-type DNA invertase [Serratia fonticola]TQI78928.1 type 1 fimbriae regulatory protein FimE [Serratia fonticola]TQI99049.1 type 1 fimbriae regulatory protein FimE [Serratia fonticola]TVZ68574.1 type 1 fimbriae regulatory protein FimE [Serratia fonticola]